MENNDRTDWSAFRRGDRSGMQRLYDRHSSAVMSFCLALCGDRNESEDTVQESFLRLMREARSHRTVNSIRGWLIVTARNLILNRRRRASCRSLDQLPENYLCAPNNPEFGTTLSRVLAGLTVAERELLLLREQQGFAVAEIAGMLGLSEENVRVRLFRIRKKIKDKEVFLK